MQQRRVRTSGLCGLMALSLFVLSASHAQAVNGNGPYYAEPAWSQKLPAATRFVVLTDWNSEAVLDRETGLVWERSPATTTHTWSAARFQCVSRTTGGRLGWRLPSVAELASLVDPSVPRPGPTLPPGHPFTTVQSADYWSATTNAENPTVAWIVLFGSGNVLSNNKSLSTPAWCVRGGHNDGSEY